MKKIYQVVEYDCQGQSPNEHVYASFETEEEANKLCIYLGAGVSYKVREAIVFSTLDEYQDSFLT